MKFVITLTLIFFTTTRILCAQELDDVQKVNENELFDMSFEKLLTLDVSSEKFKLYGFADTKLEWVANTPEYGPGGATTKRNSPVKWTPVQNFHIYGSDKVNDHLDIFFNLAHEHHAADVIEIRNAYGNMKLNHAFQVRVGKMYRKFGLYNERLDQTPSFVGIEPPEVFDEDHLFLSRFTNFMIHGELPVKSNTLLYAVTTGNPEGGPQKSVIPLGWDLRFRSYKHGLIIGMSGYASNLGNTRSAPGLQYESPAALGGVLPWMDGSKYFITGFFLEKALGAFFIQSEYWVSNHDAIRNPEKVLTLIHEANINMTQRSNFLGANAQLENDVLSLGDIVRNVKYTTSTFYVRLGYKIETEVGDLVPYLFYDAMTHPEHIRNQTFGGDNEVGLSDDGQFIKTSAGIVFRPNKFMAIKLDGSVHNQEFNGRRESYHKIRVDFAFGFEAL